MPHYRFVPLLLRFIPLLLGFLAVLTHKHTTRALTFKRVFPASMNNPYLGFIASTGFTGTHSQKLSV